MTNPPDKDEPYQPLNCSLHDRLEEAATLGRRVELQYQDSSDRVCEVIDEVLDWFVKDGAEYLRTESGLVIRLDAIVALDGVRFK